MSRFVRHTAFFFVLALLSAKVYPQKGLDSLRNVLKTAGSDTDRVKALNELALKLGNAARYDTALVCAANGVRLALQLDFKKGIADGLGNIGTVYKKQGNYPFAIKNFELTLKVCEALGDERGMAGAYNNIGSTHSDQGNYPEAVRNHFLALGLREKIGDKKGIAASYNNLGNVYNKQGNYEEALKCHLQSLQIKQSLGDKKGMASSYNNIGNVYENLGKAAQKTGNIQLASEKFAESLHNHFISLKLLQEVNYAMGLASSYNNIGNVYMLQGNYPEALKNHFESLKIKERIGDNKGIGGSYVNMAIAYNKLKQASEAEQAGLKGLAMARKLNDLETIMDAYGALSETCSLKKDEKCALHYYKSSVAVKDSLVNEENTKKSVRAQMNFEFEKKESKSRVDQEKKDAVALAEARKQRIILLCISGFGLLALAFGIFAWRSFLQKRKANEEISRQKEIIEEKQKEILDSIHYAKRIQQSLLTSERYIARSMKRP